jgi:hypothetical protein
MGWEYSIAVAVVDWKDKTNRWWVLEGDQHYQEREFLNKMGNGGWEVVDVLNITAVDQWLYFKRPKP